MIFSIIFHVFHFCGLVLNKSNKIIWKINVPTSLTLHSNRKEYIFFMIMFFLQQQIALFIKKFLE